MHGDRVVVRIARIEAGGRADGEIVKVLQRAHLTVVGEFRIGRRAGSMLVPHDGRIRQWIEIPRRHGDAAGPAPLLIALASPTAPGEFARGTGRPDRQRRGARIRGARRASGGCRVIEILGSPDDFGVDVEIVIRQHHLPHRFPPEVVEQARAIADSIDDAELASRTAISAGSISSPSMAKPRAISTTRCGWNAWQTPTMRCRSTSPT